MGRISLAGAGVLSLALGAAGCASYAVPVQHLADTQASIRTAHDSYTPSSTSAQLHLKLADEELAQAKELIDRGDNERADYILARARADAELAVGEQRQVEAEGEARDLRAALDRAREGATPAGVTMTTGATVPAPSGDGGPK